MNEYLYCFLLSLAYLAFTRSVRLRPLLWLGLLSMIFSIERLLAHDSIFVRMVVLCAALMLGMKGLVYREWGQPLSPARWFCFTFLWFGMDPSAFVKRRRNLRWKQHAVIGNLCMLGGLALSVAVAQLANPPLLLMFVPLSMAFHFGVLRILTAFWRMMGFPVRTLFRNPLVSRGVGDFWAKRWNLSFSQMIARTVQRPLQNRFGKQGALFAVFLVSGLLHEIAITVPAQSGYGLPTLYFLLHGCAVLAEKPTWPLGLSRALALLLVALPLPILFPSVFTQEVITRCLSYLTL
ncbi:MAG: wax synthase family protein [Akkermansiaceae bacterium]